MITIVIRRSKEGLVLPVHKIAATRNHFCVELFNLYVGIKPLINRSEQLNYELVKLNSTQLNSDALLSRS